MCTKSTMKKISELHNSEAKDPTKYFPTKRSRTIQSCREYKPGFLEVSNFHRISKRRCKVRQNVSDQVLGDKFFGFAR